MSGRGVWGGGGVGSEEEMALTFSLSGPSLSWVLVQVEGGR